MGSTIGVTLQKDCDFFKNSDKVRVTAFQVGFVRTRGQRIDQLILPARSWNVARKNPVFEPGDALQQNFAILSNPVELKNVITINEAIRGKTLH